MECRVTALPLRDPAADQGSIIRLGHHDLCRRAPFAQDASDTLECAPRSEATNPCGKTVRAEVPEDLGRGRPAVDVRAGFIFELPAQVPAIVLGQLFRNR